MKAALLSAVLLVAAYGALVGATCYFLPPPAVQQAKAQSVPPPAEPPVKNFSQPTAVGIKLYGPSRTLENSEYFFHVDITGVAGTPNWRLMPDVKGALVVFPDGKKARFQTAETGEYTLFVSVAGEGLAVATDVLAFDNLVVTGEHEEDHAAPPAPVAAAQVIPQVSLSDLAQQALDAVESEDKVADARTVAGSITSLIKRIEGGLVEPGADPVHEIGVAIDTALGENAKHWHPFMAQVKGIFDDLRQQGAVTTAPTAMHALTEIARVLNSAK